MKLFQAMIVLQIATMNDNDFGIELIQSSHKCNEPGCEKLFGFPSCLKDT